jgi:hypothetical protein
MGLDMYLTGDKFTPTHDNKHKRALVDGYEVESQRLALGYWRKHWALHNYIDENYESNSEGRVYLESEDLRDIAKLLLTASWLIQMIWTMRCRATAAFMLIGANPNKFVKL